MTTTTYFAYDKSHRLTTQYVLAGEAHYYTYNQRNMLTKIIDLGGAADPPRYFTYNGLAERAVVTDNSNSLPAYWSYEGRRLLQDKELQPLSGVDRWNYRHSNAPETCPLGSVTDVFSPIAEAAKTPAFEGSGSVQSSFTDFAIFDFFGRQIIGSNSQEIRARAFTSSGRLEGRMTQEIQYTSYGAWALPEKALWVGGLAMCGPGEDRLPAAVLSAFLGLLNGLTINCDDVTWSEWFWRRVVGLGRTIPKTSYDKLEPKDPAPEPCCGPDVTAQVTMTLDDIKKKFKASKEDEQLDMCDALYDVKTPHAKGSNLAAWAWDIKPLFDYDHWTGWDGGRCAQKGSKCEGTVEFAGGCYNSAVVNYVMWGVMNLLCSGVPGPNKDYPHSGDYAQSAEWILWRNFAMGRTGSNSHSSDQVGMSLFGGVYSGSGLEAAKKKLAERQDFFRRTRPEKDCATKCGAAGVPPGPWEFVWEPTFPRDPSAEKYKPKKMSLKDYYDQYQKYSKESGR